MKRYIKVNGQWIDTLIEQKEYGRYYFIVDNKVSYLWDGTMTEFETGTLEDESDAI